MGATLRNLKNKHLLAVIAVLCVGNVLACLAFVFGEKRNAADLVVLRQQQAHDRDNLAKELAQLSQRADALNQQQVQAIQSARKDLQASIVPIKDDLRSLQKFIAKLQGRKWLTSSKQEDMPWFVELQALSKRLAETEKKLEHISAPAKSGPKK